MFPPKNHQRETVQGRSPLGPYIDKLSGMTFIVKVCEAGQVNGWITEGYCYIFGKLQFAFYYTVQKGSNSLTHFPSN